MNSDVWRQYVVKKNDFELPDFHNFSLNWKLKNIIVFVSLRWWTTLEVYKWRVSQWLGLEIHRSSHIAVSLSHCTSLCFLINVLGSNTKTNKVVRFYKASIFSRKRSYYSGLDWKVNQCHLVIKRYLKSLFGRVVTRINLNIVKIIFLWTVQCIFQFTHYLIYI